MLRHHSHTRLRDILATLCSSSFWILFLIALVGAFYIPLTSIRFDTHGLGFLWVIIGTIVFDKVLVLVHLLKRTTPPHDVRCDPSKLTIVIACYNGAGVIGQTLEHALTVVPASHIIVVCDSCTDTTEVIARRYGVRVIANTTNLQKGLSVSKAVRQVTTPYVLVLDDDTSIQGVTIPTNLLDQGYAAVSFLVLPEQKEKKLVFGLQEFEYRRTMIMGKRLRADSGAVANVSGAIGLFRTDDLLYQSTRHSGQYGGEDQQRTAFAHLYSRGKGVTYVDQLVRTKVPATWRALFRQRAYKWSRATPECFWLFLQLLVSPRVPVITKLDRVYVLFVYLTEPVRMLGWVWFVVAIGAGKTALFVLWMYVFSAFWELLVYMKIRGTRSWYVVLLYPLYSKFKVGARFVAHFWWLFAKYEYLVKKRWHTHVTQRPLLQEYAGVLLVMIIMWAVGVLRFVQVVV